MINSSSSTGLLGTCFLTIALLGLPACAAATGESDEATAQLEQASICGDSTDWQDVESYDGTLGPSIAFVDAHQGPVGHLRPVGCTGTLIASNLYLTAGHCVGSTTPGSSVFFNYQNDPSGNPQTTVSHQVTAVLEDDLGGIDYAILELEGAPGDAWGITTPATFRPPAQQPITIIQHPKSLPKVVEGGTLSYLSSGRIAYDDLDTENGSSGSGILQDRTGYVVGVHTTGAANDTCNAANPNSGPSMEQIWDQSPIIRLLALDAAKVSTLF